MNCPKCAAVVEESALKTPTRGDAAKAVLLDYRVWVLAFVVMLAAGLISGMIGMNPRWATTGGGAAVGVVVASMIARARTCPTCSATFVRKS